MDPEKFEKKSLETLRSREYYLNTIALKPTIVSTLYTSVPHTQFDCRLKNIMHRCYPPQKMVQIDTKMFVLFVCLLGFNVRAAIFQLYSDDEHETDD